ncbi:lichenan operon transcriptional antiterminator [Breznakia pachnodae]|uniref:Lichenan operon transcriptional antiterminator n=2 Tax=Breznakia pachnodae TaxID=265178 RepID=A0ABU0E4Q8_9FIRM|nr:lichenan operon transcriptional antiterminator [Breznakia pachnodae]
MDDLASQLFVSKSSISTDLKTVRSILKKFNLNLITRPNYGMKVEGKEFDLRLCAAAYTINRLEGDDEGAVEETLRIISEVVSEYMKESNIRISEVSYRNLITHIYIAIERVKEGHFVPMDTDMLSSLQKNTTYDVSKRIANFLETTFEIEIPESEIGYLAVHLSGKQFIEVIPGDENVVISSEINNIVKHMLNEIKNSYNIDFTNDFELIMNLSLHLVPMDIRIRFDMNLKNPLLVDIKKRYSLAYMLALSASGILKKHYQKDVDEEEIGYIALHFNLALERQKSMIAKKNIVIVCATGKGSASLLIHKFKSEVGNYLNNVVALDVMHLEDYDFSDIDYVVTTVPIPYKVPVPILEIQFFMDDKDIKAIKNLLQSGKNFALERFFDQRLFIPRLRARNKDEVISTMVNKIKEIKSIPNEFYDLIMKREEMSITAFGNLVAIPHPCKSIGEETFVCVAILDEPILWDEVEVQFVFMMSLKEIVDENMDTFSSMVSKLLINNSYVKAIIELRKYQTLIDCFNDIEREMRN